MKSKLIIIGALLFGLAVGLVGTMLLSNKSVTTGPCGASAKNSKSYRMAINNSKVQPAYITGKLCDTLTITNNDATTRLIAFGPHEDHVPYDGVTERILTKGQSFTITLNKPGSYHWHDHLHDEVEGYFAVIY